MNRHPFGIISKLIIFTCTLFNATAILAQGFYDNNSVLINKSAINKLNISHVTATYDYPDSSFHQMSNFVFEYRFDEAGNTNWRKFWDTKIIKGNKFLNITLIVDSVFHITPSQDFHYECLSQSKAVKFNQRKIRTKRFVKKTFDQFNSLEPVNKFYLTQTRITRDVIEDTILLDKKVSIPYWLIPSGDSTTITNDTLIVFDKHRTGYNLASKSYPTKNNYFQIDWHLNTSPGKVWRSYYIDAKGLVYKETQDIYKILYFYNQDNLHIRTENYNNKELMATTYFKYQ